MAFFRRGEELEATGFETLPYDDPMLVPPKLGVRRFDKIPRNHAPLVIIALLIVVAALIVFGRRSIFHSPDQTAGVGTSAHSKASGLETSVETSPSTP
jgi:hypothetical protein